MTLSKSQIDRLGERLKSGSPSEADLQLLDEYRSSLLQAYEQVIRLIREQLGLQISGRERKTTQSIVEKLRRQGSMQLSQMQDIAGCRVVVANVVIQDNVIGRVTALFAHSAQVKVIDRRAAPSHGYRAIHVVIRFDRFPIEVQVRTVFQHRWADLSEKLADQFHDQTIKYGGGPEEIRSLLTRLSSSVEEFEKHQRGLIEESERLAGLLEGAQTIDESTKRTIDAFDERATETVRRAAELRKEFESLRTLLQTRKGPLH